MSQKLLDYFRPLFYPRSVAVVGASPDESKIATRFFKTYLDVGFQGQLYPIHPEAKEVFGHPAYPSIKDVPGPLDYVTVQVPASQALKIIRDAGEKGVRFVHFFTAGFTETGSEAGARLEAEALALARRYGVRIIGPNCLGLFHPAHRMPLAIFPRVGKPGPVGFISQSGGQSEKLVELGLARGVTFSKGVSFGNGRDLDSPEYLEYLGADPQTRFIGAYLEGVGDGRRLFEVMKRVTPGKPFVVWKGGGTGAGSQTAFSHTGSLAGTASIWEAVLRQSGAIPVSSIEELVDTLLAFQRLPPFEGRRVAVIAGLAGGGGGEAVASADICSRHGLEVPPIMGGVEGRLRELIAPVGTIFRNPLDIGMARGSLEGLREIINIALAQPYIDLLLINESADSLLRWGIALGFRVNDIFLEARRKQPKPIVVCSIPGLIAEERMKEEARLVAGGIPVFPSLDRASRAIYNVSSYWRWRQG